MIPDVASKRQALDAMPAALVGEGLEIAARAQRITRVAQGFGNVQSGDIEPLPSQSQRRGPPLPVSRTGYESYFAIGFHFVFPSLA
jgi:hypothetical protein